METGTKSSPDEYVNLTASIKMTKAFRLAKLKTKCEDVPRADVQHCCTRDDSLKQY